MSKILYNAVLFFYTFFIRIAAFIGNQKAKKWKEGRQGIFKKLTTAFANNSAPVLWIHCASLGEFEQGRPVIEALKQKTSNLKILLTFFSPSGYEIRQNYAQADWVFYLPSDSKKNAAQFISIVKPQQVIFVKYEFWYYYLTMLQKQNIPAYLISAIFRPNQVFFKWYGGLFREILFCFKGVFVQNEDSLSLLQQINYTQAYLAGDTRLDRVLEIKNKAQKFSILETFCAANYNIIAGSTWLPDEQILSEVLKAFPKKKLIIAPHQIDEKHLQDIEKQFHFTKLIRYSKVIETSQLSDITVLLIDNIGMLSSIYAYANIAYIGGGFGAGIHSTLEAAVFEIPVLFGPNHHKFQEAKDLIEESVAFEVNNSQEVIQQINTFQKVENSSVVQQKAQLYFQKNSGASLMIVNYLETKNHKMK
jgi:3-deoxy-D-manno-octulosonic-acid transferase